MANIPEQSELNDKPVKSDKAGYFKRIISDLQPNKIYELQFMWQYADGSYGPPSLIKKIITPSFEVGADPKFDAGDVVGIPGAIKITWGGKDVSGYSIETSPEFDRVDIHIAGTSFGDGTKPSGNFKKSGTLVFKCEPGIYIVQLKIYKKNGQSTFFSSAHTVTVPPIEEEVEPPVTPKGFSSERVLSGIEVAWDGTYTGNAEWYGFQAINIYAGTSPTATSGTYIKVGQMTANKTGNKIVVPVDGTYVKYDSPVYIHASSINRKAEESAIAANVTNQLTGARSAVPSDLSDNIITNQKLVDGAVNAVKIATGAITEVKIDDAAITAAKIAAGAITEVKIDTAAITAAKIAAGAITEVKIDNNAITAAKIATGAITETKIASDAITTPKIAAGAIEAGKIAAGAITAEKIATNAIEADKIAANAITATKIAAGAIEAGKIAAGAITAEKIAASAIEADKIATNAITAVKIAAGAIEAGKIAAGAITAEKIATNAIEADKIAADAITSSKIIAGAITSAKIDALAITSDKIAAGAIVASKIQAGEINASKLAAGTISANNMEAGIITSSTFVRAGSAGSARVEMSSSQIGNVLPGLTIYGSNGTTQILRAGLDGNLAITGHLTATQISTSSNRFRVDSNGYLNASDVDLTGSIKANGGDIGGIKIFSDSLQNANGSFKLDNSGKARFGSANGDSLIINPAANVGNSWIYYSPDGGDTGSNKFRVTSNGTLYADSAIFSGNITSTATINGGSLVGATIKTSDSGTYRIEVSEQNSYGQFRFYGYNENTLSPHTNYGYLVIGPTWTESQGVGFGPPGIRLQAPDSNMVVHTALELVDLYGTPNANLIATGGSIFLDSTYVKATGAYVTGAFSTSSVFQSPGTYISGSGAIISRRDDQIPIFAHKFNSNTPYTGTTQHEIIRLILQGTVRGQITASMTQSPAISAPSDYRLKENIRDYNNSIDVIKSKRLRVFNLKDDPTKTEVVGFIAHEFGPDNSEFVIGSKDAVDKDGNPEYQSVAFTNLIPYLTGALKEIIIRVESLEQRLDALES